MQNQLKMSMHLLPRLLFRSCVHYHSHFTKSVKVVSPFTRHYPKLSLIHTSCWKLQSESSDKDSDDLDDILREIHKDFGEPQTLDSAKSSVGQIDVDKELMRYDYEEFVEEDENEYEETEPAFEPCISMERGEHGVFDIDEVVTVLREDNGRDIVTLQIPAEVNYAEHMVVVTGRSIRHLTAMAGYLNKLYKKKRHRGDPPTVKIEGGGTEWLAMDMGNVVVHLFLASMREQYDLETLWTVGPEYDPQSLGQEAGQTLYWGADNTRDVPGADNTLNVLAESGLGTTAEIENQSSPRDSIVSQQGNRTRNMDSRADWHSRPA